MRRLPKLAFGFFLASSVGLWAACATYERPNEPPEIVRFEVDRTSGAAPFTARFDWEVSDPEGDALDCTLDFGDGVEHAVACAGSITHDFSDLGTFAATLTARDPRASASATLEIAAVTEFDVDLRFETAVSDAQRRALEAAAARWARAVTGDVSPVSFDLEAGACGNANAESIRVDDLVIFVSIEPIDGEGNVLGSAGPCYVRASNGLPFIGTMRFDEADVANLEARGTFDAVVLHEMGHVLGLGTLWSYRDLLGWEEGVGSCQEAADIRYLGLEGNRAWQEDLARSGQPPVENEGGAGTKCGHWKEAVLQDELMTGWLSGDRQPLSRLTAAALEDLGYHVNLEAADAYVVPASALQGGVEGWRIAEELVTPVVVFDTP
ncbi:leishmanolysin-related zinc metalloendopeptidase [Oceanithermus sp.]